MKRAFLAVMLALLLGGCAWGGRDRGRMLPPDRNARLRYVAMGDSTVEGVGATSPEAGFVGLIYARLRTVYPRARLANLGVAGATSADVVRDQLERAVRLGPDLVTLSVGPNDVTSHVAVEQYERNVGAIFAKLTSETRAVVVANFIPDLEVTPRFKFGANRGAVGRQTVLFNRALDRKGRKYGVELVDLYAASREEVPQRPELVGADGYHPSDEGYGRWAELLWKGIESRMASP